MTHATPASLYAHSADRDWECYRHIKHEDDLPEGVHEIAWQLMRNEPGKNIKVILGGGLKTMLPKGDDEWRSNDDDYQNDYDYKCYTEKE